MPKRVQAKHVPEDAIIRALASTERWMTHWALAVRAGWGLVANEPVLADFPEKVLLAKLRAMRNRGLIDGCPCGCRGDWHLTEVGKALAREAGYPFGNKYEEF